MKANKCNHMIRVSRCVTSLYPGVFVCLPAFRLGGTSEVVKFFLGRVGGYDFEVAHLLRGSTSTKKAWTFYILCPCLLFALLEYVLPVKDFSRILDWILDWIPDNLTGSSVVH